MTAKSVLDGALTACCSDF